MKGSKIHIENCQVKSKEKLTILCKCLDTMEKEFGVKSVRISFDNIFICPDINLKPFCNSKKPMEKLVGKLIVKINKQIKKEHNGSNN